MPRSRFKGLAKVKQLIYMGCFNEALQIIQHLENRTALPAFKRFECQILRIMILNKQGHFKNALTLAEQILQDSKNLKDPGKQLDALIVHLETLYLLGEVEESLKMVAQGERILETLISEQTTRDSQRRFFRFPWYLKRVRNTQKQSKELLQQKSALLYHKGKLHEYKGELNESLEYAQQSLALRRKLGDKQTIADSLNTIGIVFARQGELWRALEYFEQSLVLLEELGNKQEVAKSLNNIGYIHQQLSKLEQALEYFQRSLRIREDFGHKGHIAQSLDNIGIVYRRKGVLDQALDYFQQALTLRKAVGNKQEIAASLNNIGVIYRAKGDMNRALEVYNESLRLFEILGNKQDIARVFLNIGEVYISKGVLDKALTYLEQSLHLRETLGNKQDIARVLLNISDVETKKGELNRALVHLKQCLTLYEQLGDNIFIAITLYSLITLSNEEAFLEQAQGYLKYLRQINDQEENKIISQHYRVAEAFLLKASTRMKNRVRAQEILEQVVEEEVVDNLLTLDAMIYLCELLLFEFHVTNDLKILNETRTYVEKLQEIAQQQQLYLTLGEVYILQAKLALLELDLIKTQSLLEKAQILAEEKGLKQLSARVFREQVAFRNQMDQWQRLVDQQAPMRERLELVQLETQILQMAQKRLEVTEEELSDYAQEARKILKALKEKR